MIEEMMRTSEMKDGVFHLKDYAEAMDRYHNGRAPVWGAWTESEVASIQQGGTRAIQHWVETPVGLTETQARQAVKVAVEAKTGQRVRPMDIVYDP